MTTFAALVEDVYKLSKEELIEIKRIVDKQLAEERIEEIEEALKSTRSESAEGKLKYYTSGEGFVSSLNED